jgi:HAMP domain-containing protein
MTASNLTMPKAPGIGASEPTATDGAVRRPRLARERSLTEMMSISDWYWFVPETIGLLLLIALFRAVLPAGASGVGMPHPFWIPVLLMSGQYGIMGGLFATLAASAALFVSGLPPQSAAQDFYAYAGVVAAQPCGWFATALIMGGLRSLHIHHQTDLLERLDQTEMAATDPADGLERAVGEIERLEQRIATDSSTLAAFLNSLAKLEWGDRRSLLASIADVIRYGVGATSFVIHLKGRDGLEPCLGIEDGNRLAATAIASLPSLLLRQIGDEVMRAPLVDGDGCLDSKPIWASIRLEDSAELLGVVVCNRLLTSQHPAIAVRRLNEVCRVLAVLLSACPEVIRGAPDE